VAALVVGVGALAGGAALTVMAQQLNHDFNHPTPGTVYDHQVIDRWTAEQQAAIGLYVVGAAALVGGVALSVAGWRAPAEGRPRRWSLAPALAPSLVGASATVRF
jgi:hypothetical protein